MGCFYHFFKIIRLGKPNDFAQPAGMIGPAVTYSFTGGMSPRKKESAYLHLPTYAAGIVYHLGTFISIALFFCFLSDLLFSRGINFIFSAFLLLSGCCGIGVFIKRIVKPNLRSLSNPDDYISNLLVTAFQMGTAVFLFFPNPSYFVLAALLMLYFPAGKLKHAVNFFAARYQLGVFFGRRGVWPPENE